MRTLLELAALSLALGGLALLLVAAAYKIVGFVRPRTTVPIQYTKQTEPKPWRGQYPYPSRIRTMIEDPDVPLIELVLAVESWADPPKSPCSNCREPSSDLHPIGYGRFRLCNLCYQASRSVLHQRHWSTIQPAVIEVDKQLDDTELRDWWNERT